MKNPIINSFQLDLKKHLLGKGFKDKANEIEFTQNICGIGLFVAFDYDYLHGSISKGIRTIYLSCGLFKGNYHALYDGNEQLFFIGAVKDYKIIKKSHPKLAIVILEILNVIFDFYKEIAKKTKKTSKQ